MTWRNRVENLGVSAASVMAEALRAQTAPRRAPSPNGADPTAGYLPDLDVDPIRPLVDGHAPVSAKIERVLAQPRPPRPNLCARPQVSVVIGSFNRVRLLPLAIESVRANFANIDGEIIVVDGGSTDGTLEYLARQDDVITIIQHNRFKKDGEAWRRKSWGGFMNLAFRCAAADNVLMISDDCFLLVDAIDEALARMAAAEAAGVTVGGCAFYFRNWPDESAYYVQRTLGGNLMINHGIYKKAALEAAQYADEDNYVFYKADSDLSLKIWRAGYAIIDAPRSVCEHYIGPGEDIRASNEAVMEYDRDVMRRHWPHLIESDAVKRMGKIELPALPSRAAEIVWGDVYKADCDAHAAATA